MVAVRASAGGFDTSTARAALPPFVMILGIFKRGLIRDLQRQ
jgi:hypothetical protein